MASNEPQAFWVEGLAAVSEYLKWRPDVVRTVQCLASDRVRVERMLRPQLGGIPLVTFQPQNGGESETHKGSGPGRRDTRRRSQRSEDGEVYTGQAPVAARVLLRVLGAEQVKNRWAESERDLILALDHVQDPRNLGAIVRSAAYFGLRHVLVPERRQVHLTQASVSTAQGGFALVDLVSTVNLARALRDLQGMGYWVIGAHMGGEAPQDLSGVYDKVVLVMGAEETGLSRNVVELCDRTVGIRGNGKLDSLNVSVAAGILLEHLAFRA